MKLDKTFSIDSSLRVLLKNMEKFHLPNICPFKKILNQKIKRFKRELEIYRLMKI